MKHSKVPAYGADVLRFWVATTDSTSDVSIGPSVVGKASDALRKVRNTCLTRLKDIRLHWISQLQGDIPLEDVPGSVFLEEGWMPSAKEWENHDLARDWTAIRQLRLEVNRVVEKMRQAGRVGSHLECSVSVSASESDPRMQTLLFPHNRSSSELPDVFRCSSAEIVDLEHDIENAEQFKADCQRSMGTNEAPINITLVLTSAKGHKCPRCWKYAPEVPKMRVPSARRFVTAVCVLLLAGRGSRTLCFYIMSLVKRLRALTLTRASSPSSWKLFSVFLNDLKDHRVDKVLLAREYCTVYTKDHGDLYKVLVPPRTTMSYLVDLLRQYQVEFGSIPVSALRRFVPIAFSLVPFLYLGLTYKLLRRMFTNETGTVGKDGTKDSCTTHATARISFQDVAGIDDARKELEEVVDFLQHPTKYHAIGAKIPKGVLLCGPSGTGKTLLARAVASEAGVAFLFCSASDFVEMLVGRGAARVRDLFTQASEYPQCVVFIDEIDALAKARGGLNSNDEREQTLNQLLTEMDGFEGKNNGVLVLAATNRPEVLDPALCRPGRFDRHVVVGLPDTTGREQILHVHCRHVRLDPDVDLARIAEQCGHVGQRSGAQLACLVNEAALLAVRQGATRIKHAHFELAMTRAAASRTQRMAGSSLEFPLENEA
ncbi:hypothetical protein PsorP6_017660 [Peronosclerospora sorghi]|uniref:Uncharacterized protein n=1 Tax=Peronosclerospora sorghi TaxID=230839 RepID=A0ACC0WL87_9STRA|nr:hypothetical protein PsorP6_017660 [Peronosclerospora sorghi]